MRPPQRHDDSLAALQERERGIRVHAVVPVDVLSLSHALSIARRSRESTAAAPVIILFRHDDLLI
jgi:hypothetical protein